MRSGWLRRRGELRECQIKKGMSEAKTELAGRRAIVRMERGSDNDGNSMGKQLSQGL